MTQTDILIAGAGPAGLAAACALAAEGHAVTLVDPAPPVTGEDAPGADLRTTALLQPARDLLERAGAWDAMRPHAAELWTMRIVDAASRPHVTREFDAMDVSDAPFGWNFPNWLIRRELLARAEALGVETRFGRSVERLFTRETEARVTLSDGARISARLVLACDGKTSPLREMAGIGARTVDYGQTAVVFAVAHAAPHHDVSTEIHRRGGPFTLVPLPDRDGAHRSAVVWMDRSGEQERRMALPDDIFAAEVNERAVGIMGELEVISPRAAWPIVSRLAERMSGRRVALAAEAAHAMPPIGAQGLNTSLADIACLRDLIAGRDPGDPALLDRYHRRRWPEVAARMAGVDLLNRTSIAGASPVQAARAWGVGAIHDAAPVRKLLMRLGMGTANPA